MNLKIDELIFEIERFNATIAFDLNKAVSRLDFTLANKLLNPTEVGVAVAEAYQGELIFESGTKTYTFTDYDFESVDIDVDIRSETMVLRFSK